MFLLRMGFFTLIKMDSFIVLVKSCPSLPTLLKFSSVVIWPVVEWWSYIDEGDLRSSPNFLADSPVYSSLQARLLHLYQYITKLFVVFGPDP